MEQLLKQFTLIDFTGIFAPGAVMTLALNFCVLDLTAPFKDFFGENAVMLALYFLTVSYLLGNALHQSGACLEFIWKVDFDHVSYCKSPEIQAAYQRCFYTPMPADIKTAGNRIFHYLQRNSRPERIIIFNSFYTMSRTMVVTLACLIPITIYYRREALVSWPLALQLLAYVLAMILFRCRWSRFEKVSRRGIPSVQLSEIRHEGDAETGSARIMAEGLYCGGGLSSSLLHPAPFNCKYTLNINKYSLPMFFRTGNLSLPFA